MPNWKKLIVSGSDASLNSLTVNGAITADTISGSFSGSYVGDGSGLTNVNANVAQVATVSDTFTSTTSKTVNHLFGTKDVIVTVYNDSDQQILPASITTTDNNNVTVTFDSNTTGRVVVAKGGHIVSGSAANAANLNGQPGTYYLDYTNATNTKYQAEITGSTSYILTHNLNDDFPFVQVYNADKKQVLPGIVSASNANTVLLEFDSTFNGTVIIKR